MWLSLSGVAISLKVSASAQRQSYPLSRFLM